MHVLCDKLEDLTEICQWNIVVNLLSINIVLTRIQESSGLNPDRVGGKGSHFERKSWSKNSRL